MDNDVTSNKYIITLHLKLDALKLEMFVVWKAKQPVFSFLK